jgi:YfiH family protein
LYAHRETHGPVELAFTNRLGGVSAVPFDSLNLAWGGGDDEDAMAENRRRLMEDFGPDDFVAYLHQVHGNQVVVVDDHRSSTWPPKADGLVTAQPGITLMVRGADCLPVLLADEPGEVLGAAHCGRPGLVAGVVPATIAAMRRVTDRPITAWMGPHVCGGCYEVPADMQDEVAAVEPASRATTTWGTPSVDLGAGVRAQLERDDIAVVDVSRCTRESNDLYSYRRDGRGSGRQAGIIRRSA